jgi:ribonuclease Z
MPMANRYLTSLLVSYGGRMLLIDCGEGTQVSLKLLKWGFKSIEAICFTHYHADHVVGFPGLLLTIANSGREEPLTVIGPPGLREVVAGLRVIVPYLPFELKLLELKEDKAGFTAVGNFKLETQPVEHSMPCFSYKLEVERMRRFNREKAEKENVPMEFWNRLRKGEQIQHQGRILTKEMILGEERKGLKLCYCTDTRPVESLIPFIREADLFICEGMYGEDEYLPKALLNKHMLFSEAANLAQKGEVKELWLTHYSPSLMNPSDYIENTKRIFNNTFLGEDRMTTTLNFVD